MHPNSWDRSTTPQGYTAGGKTHQGGDCMGAECTQIISPPVMGHRSPVMVNQAPLNQASVNQSPVSQSRSTSQWSASHQSLGSLSQVNWAPVNQSLVIWFQVPVTGLWSPVTNHPVTGHSEVITRLQSTGIRHLISRHQALSTSHWAPVNLPGTSHQASFDRHWIWGSQSNTGVQSSHYRMSLRTQQLQREYCYL